MNTNKIGWNPFNPNEYVNESPENVELNICIDIQEDESELQYKQTDCNAFNSAYNDAPLSQEEKLKEAIQLVLKQFGFDKPNQDKSNVAIKQDNKAYPYCNHNPQTDIDIDIDIDITIELKPPVNPPHPPVVIKPPVDPPKPPVIIDPPVVKPPVDIWDHQLDPYEIADLIKKIAGSDEKISVDELDAALKNQTSNLTPDQKELGQELLIILKVMQGAGVFGEKSGISAKDILEMAEADGNHKTLSLIDTAKMIGVWCTSQHNNDGQLSVNELFANNGDATFNGLGMFGWGDKNKDKKLSEKELDLPGPTSQDEKLISKALKEYVAAKVALGLEASVSAQELKDMMSKDKAGSDMALTLSDIKIAIQELKPPVDIWDHQLDPYEIADLIKKIAGSDEKISVDELDAALKNQASNLTPDQKELGQELLIILKVMQGAGVFGQNASISSKDILEMAEADGNHKTLSLTDTAKMIGVWCTSQHNNDGQLAINELFANNGDGNFNALGMFGWGDKNKDKKLSEKELDLPDPTSQDEKLISKALKDYVAAKVALGLEASVSTQELKDMMSKDKTGSDMVLTVSDIKIAIQELQKSKPPVPPPIVIKPPVFPPQPPVLPPINVDPPVIKPNPPVLPPINVDPPVVKPNPPVIKPIQVKPPVTQPDLPELPPVEIKLPSYKTGSSLLPPIEIKSPKTKNVKVLPDLIIYPPEIAPEEAENCEEQQ